MSRTVIGITHAADNLDRFFSPADLAGLHKVADVRILGSNDPDLFADQLADLEILLGSWGMPPLTADLLAAAPKLKAVCYAAGTVKGFATPEAFARDIIITTAMHANAIPVAEVTLALITLANKNWFRCQETIATKGEAGFAQARDNKHCGNYDATVGLIGFGAIGREVATRLQPMALDVVVYDPFANDALFAEYGCRPCTDLVELAGAVDVVSLHAPNVPETRHMLSTTFFQAMRDGATFINTARGALVDEDALVAELETGRIDAYLDVTFPEPPEANHPFYRLPNCWLTPHRAGSSAREIRRMGNYAIAECHRIIHGTAPRYRVVESMLATMA